MMQMEMEIKVVMKVEMMKVEMVEMESLLLKLRMPSPTQLKEQLPSAFELFDGDERRIWRKKEKEEPMLLRERPLLLYE